MSTKKQREPAQLEENKQRAIKALRKVLKPGSTLYSFRYGWVRSTGGCHVAFFVVNKGQIENISNTITDITGHKWLDKNALLASSAFSVVMSLSYALHGEENKGRKEAYPPTPDNYKAGYSLIHKEI